jgi:CSLREA domain-containing protein
MKINGKSVRQIIGAVFGVAALGTFSLGFAMTPRITAVGILVNSTGDDTTAGDHLCTLREAINNTNAQADTTSGDCAAGTGDDVINFDPSLAGQTIAASTAGDTSAGLSAFIINHRVTIRGLSSDPGITIARSSTGPNIRLFTVASGASLTLQYLTVSDGVARGGNGGSGFGFTGGGAAGLGGAIFNFGSLTVLSSTLSNNQAIGGNGGAFDGNGSATSGGGGLSGNGGAGFGGSGGPPNGGAGAGFAFTSGGPGGFGGGGGGGSLGGGAGGFGGGGGGGNCGGAGGPGGFGGGGGAGSQGSPCGAQASGGAVGFGGGAGGFNIGGGGAGLGGAIFNYGGQVQIINSTVSGNIAQGGTGNASGAGIGGGVFNLDGTITLNNSTIAFNTANQGGGAAYNLAMSNTAILDTANTIFKEGTGGTIANNGGTVTSRGYNLSSDGADNGSGGTLLNGTGDQINTDPLLGPLQDNGGPTFTHALLTGSPAIDAGDPAFDPNAFTPPLTYDQRGVGYARVVNNLVDIG